MPITRYLDFVLLCDEPQPGPGGLPGGFSVRVVSSPYGTGEKTEIVRLPDGLVTQMDAFLARSLDADPAGQMAVGRALADLLLPPHARHLYHQSLARLKPDEGLRLRLQLDDALGVFPWECAYIQESRGESTSAGFLLLDPRLSIVRDLPLSIPPDDSSRTASRRRVAAVFASPANLATLPGLDGERSLLEETLGTVPGLDAVFLSPFGSDPAPTLDNLSDALALQSTDVFHFAGHGLFRQTPAGIGESKIALQTMEGQASPLAAAELGRLLRSNGVGLAVFSACHTAGRDPLGVWNSMAAAVLQARIPAVVAMQTKIRDRGAAAFSRMLYRALVAGLPLDYAVAAGRSAIRNATGEAIDWCVPALYLRGGDRPVFPPVEDSGARSQAERELESPAPQPAAPRVVQNIGTLYGPAIGELKGDLGPLVYNFGPESDRPPETPPPAAGRPADSSAGSDQVCRSCGEPNPAGARFCQACGVELKPRQCAACGAGLSAAARFCPACGAAVG